MNPVSRPRPGRKRGFLPGLFPHYGCSIGFFLAQSLSSMNLTIPGTGSAHGDGAIAIPSGSKFAYITVFSGANLGYILALTTTSRTYYISHSSSSSLKSCPLDITANTKIGYKSDAVDSDGFCCILLG